MCQTRPPSGSTRSTSRVEADCRHVSALLPATSNLPSLSSPSARLLVRPGHRSYGSPPSAGPTANCFARLSIRRDELQSIRSLSVKGCRTPTNAAADAQRRRRCLRQQARRCITVISPAHNYRRHDSSRPRTVTSTTWATTSMGPSRPLDGVCYAANLLVMSSRIPAAGYWLLVAVYNGAASI